MRIRMMAIIVSLAAAACLCGAEGETWLGPKHRGVLRENVFEFAKKPTFKKVARDRYEIAFASKGKCDVAVAVEDAKGKILRHIAAGVLGANVPLPLQKDSLSQTLVWDGKDDFGKYVEKPEACRVRVSLGLSPTFDRLIARHPKDITGSVQAIGADKDGVYVASVGPQTIKAFGHDGEYLRTVYPWPGDSFREGKVIGEKTGFAPGGENTPGLGYYSITGWSEGTCNLAIREGTMLLYTVGWRSTKRIIRIGTDGTSRMQDIKGPMISRARSHIFGSSAAAVSPDRKWIYYIPLGQSMHGKIQGAGNGRHAVFRLGWNSDGPLGQPYIGEEGKKAQQPGSDNRHFNTPVDIACDAKGRIYVADYGNNRIQIFEPAKGEGKHVKTVPCEQPRRIAIHHETGELYAVHGTMKGHGSGRHFRWVEWSMKITRFGPFGGFAAKQTWDIPKGVTPGAFCLDSWTAPPRIWLASGATVRVFQAGPKELEKVRDFHDEVRKDGYNPHGLSGSKMFKVVATPGGGPVYYFPKGGIKKVDPKEGRKLVPVYLSWRGPFNCDEIDAGYDGFFYVRGIAWVGRFKHPTKPFRDGVLLDENDEVPFDYGERIDLGRDSGMRSHSLRSAIRLSSQPGGNFFNMGFDVAPNGDIWALCENNQGKMKLFKHGGLEKVHMEAERSFKQFMYKPTLIPGCLYGGQLVFVWNRRGELQGENLVTTPTGNTCGIRGDRDGDVYFGLGMRPRDENGKPYPFDNAGVGALVKFPRSGGKIYTKGKGVSLATDRPAEFSKDYGGKPYWSQNMLWKYPGFGVLAVASNVCTCPNSRFDVDVYGRVFAPEHWRHSVAILDTNGNLVMHCGEYGNTDDAPKVASERFFGGEAEDPGMRRIPVGLCCHASVDSDRWLYFSDEGNCCITRARLGYAAQEIAELQKGDR